MLKEPQHAPMIDSLKFKEGDGDGDGDADGGALSPFEMLKRVLQLKRLTGENGEGGEGSSGDDTEMDANLPTETDASERIQVKLRQAAGGRGHATYLRLSNAWQPSPSPASCRLSGVDAHRNPDHRLSVRPCCPSASHLSLLPNSAPNRPDLGGIPLLPMCSRRNSFVWFFIYFRFFLSNSFVPCLQAGCTAVVALKARDKLYVANAGDSRGVLCRGGQAVALSEDHKPASDIERARIEKAGGYLSEIGAKLCSSAAVPVTLQRGLPLQIFGAPFTLHAVKAQAALSLQRQGGVL